MQGNPSRGRGAVRSGLLTGISTAAVSGSAAVAGIILSRKFGHGVKTDGFFAAYGVHLALVLVANALRVVALPRFAVARAEGRLRGEVGTWLVALAVPLLPAVVLSIAWADGIARVLASALAAFDDYGTAALGFGAGAVAGLAAIAALIGHGVVAFGWGLALNGAIALAVPLV